MSQKGVLKNTIYYSVGEILPRVINFLLLPLYTRYLSPSDYGIISYTQAVYSFLLILSTLSLNSYVLRYYFIHKKSKEQKEMIGTVFVTILLCNIFLVGIGFAFLPNIIEHYHIQIPWDPFFKFALTINFLDCFSIIPLVVYRVRQEAKKFVRLGVSRSLFTIALTVFFVAYQQRGVIGSYQAQLYVYLPFSFVYIFCLRNHTNLSFKRKYLIEGLKYSMPLLPGAVCYVLLSMSDRLILERNVGIGQLGIYNIAATMAMVLNVVVQSGYKAIEPEMFKRYGTEDYYSFVRRGQGLFFFVIYSGAMALCLFSQEAFFIMTTKSFHHGYWLVPVLILSVVMTGQNIIYGGVLLSEKRTKVQGGAMVIGSIINICLNLVFVPIWGVYAAATVSAISYIVINLYLFQKMTFPGKSIWRELLLVILIPVIAYIVFFFMNNINMQNIIIKMLMLMVYMRIAIKLFGLNLDCVHVLPK